MTARPTYEELQDKIRRLEEKALESRQELERAADLESILRAVRDVNQLIVREKHRNRLLQGVCDRLTETRGYFNLWIALFDEYGALVTAVEAGLGRTFLPMVERLQAGDLPPCGRAALEGEAGVVLTEDPPSSCTGCVLAERYGGHGAITARIGHAGKVYGLMVASIPAACISESEDPFLFSEIAGDLGLALYALEEEEKRVEAEEAVARMEAELRATLYCVGDGLITTDNRGRVTMMNPVAEALTGWSEATARGKPLEEVFRIVNEETRRPADNPVERVFREGIVVGLANHTLLIARDGTERAIADSGAPVRDKDGRIAGVVLVFRDQTAERAAQRQVARARAFAEDIIATVRDPLLVLDAQLRVLTASRAFYRLFGVTPTETEGHTVYELGNRQWDIPELLELLQDIVLQNTAFENYQIERDVPGLGRRKMLLNARRVHHDGAETDMILLAIEDITDRRRLEDTLREREEELSVILAHAPVALIIVDRQRAVQRANHMAVKTAKRRLEEEMIGLRWGEALRCLHALDAPEGCGFGPACDECIVRKTVLKVLETGEAHHHIDGSLQFQDDGGGTETHFLLSAAPIHLAGQTLVLVSLLDVTERKALEEQLLRSQRLEAIGALAGGIAHDFNNILAAVTGFTEMALFDAPDDSVQKANIQEVLRAALRGKDLVRQILTFSRPPEDRVLRPVRVADILREALHLIRPAVPSTIEIREAIDSESDLILGDPSQVHQVFLNLLVNAEQAMRDKGGVLEVCLAREDLDARAVAPLPDLAPGPYLKTTVKDTGPGMDRKILARIFDPFFTTKGPAEGTGMGLSVAHGIVRNHGGSITVASQPGKGSTFEVYLPCLETRKNQPEGEATEALPEGQGRILFVDDDEALVNVGRQMLEHLGYEVTVMTSGPQALEAFRAAPKAFELVITDQAMPHMTGTELAGKIRRIRADTPIILCTGFGEACDPAAVREAGVREVLTKPVSIDDLARAVQSALQTPDPSTPH